MNADLKLSAAPPGLSPLSLERLREWGWYAQMAYQDCRDWPAATEVFDSATDTKAVIWGKQDVVIALRGTFDMPNWLLDLDVRKVPLAGASAVKVHAGFLRGANALLPLIINALLPFPQWPAPRKDSVSSITIVGHSLGGAMATLMALALHNQGFNVVNVVTFASPRVGNAAWRELYNAALGEATMRVVAAGDLVPLVPGVLDGYRHVGQEVFLDVKAWLNPSRITEVLCDSWRAWLAVCRRDAAFLLEFHSMEKDYLKLLAAAGAGGANP